MAPAMESDSAYTAESDLDPFAPMIVVAFPWGSASSSASFWSSMMLLAPVSSTKSYGPRPLIVTGTTIRYCLAILILTVTSVVA